VAQQLDPHVRGVEPADLQGQSNISA
jgi:hypothetical protein